MDTHAARFQCGRVQSPGNQKALNCNIQLLIIWVTFCYELHFLSSYFVIWGTQWSAKWSLTFHLMPSPWSWVLFVSAFCGEAKREWMRRRIPGKLTASLQLCASPGLTALSTKEGCAHWIPVQWNVWFFFFRGVPFSKTGFSFLPEKVFQWLTAHSIARQSKSNGRDRQ